MNVMDAVTKTMTKNNILAIIPGFFFVFNAGYFPPCAFQLFLAIAKQPTQENQWNKFSY